MDIDIENLRKYFEEDNVLVSDHASKRFQERDIEIGELRFALKQGEIIEQYPDDYPFPSCLILGKTSKGDVIHFVMSDEGTMSRIITAYYPDPDQWSEDFKFRKEQEP